MKATFTKTSLWVIALALTLSIGLLSPDWSVFGRNKRDTSASDQYSPSEKCSRIDDGFEAGLDSTTWVGMHTHLEATKTNERLTMSACSGELKSSHEETNPDDRRIYTYSCGGYGDKGERWATNVYGIRVLESNGYTSVSADCHSEPCYDIVISGYHKDAMLRAARSYIRKGWVFDIFVYWGDSDRDPDGWCFVVYWDN